ncbi:MAG: V-type ATP synthase subunit A, partial [Candidatus Omnitrophota bacterium]
TGMTLAEYYRDMGYHVALMADSTSRWAEALREISSRLEEMPGEEGFPTYLGTRLAQFYERSGRVVAQGKEKRIGSVTVVGAISPPGGDFSEPVTQSTLRIVGALWALDSNLAYRRHFPSVNWNRSYTLYYGLLKKYFEENVSPDWSRNRDQLFELIQKETQLQEIVQLVGPDALQDEQRLILEFGRMIREGFLQQNAFSPVDGTCPLKKQHLMLATILQFYHRTHEAIQQGIRLQTITELPVKEEIDRLKDVPLDALEKKVQTIQESLERQIGALGIEKGQTKLPLAQEGER